MWHPPNRPRQAAWPLPRGTAAATRHFPVRAAAAVSTRHAVTRPPDRAPAGSERPPYGVLMSALSTAMLVPLDAGLRPPVLMIVNVCAPEASCGLVHTTPDALRLGA